MIYKMSYFNKEGHYFITCFWGNDPYRTRLCQEFCDRYPNVILLQNKTDIKAFNTIKYSLDDVNLFNGSLNFIDYKMINEFLKSVKGLKSFTLLDSDLILGPNFFKKVIKKQQAFKEPIPYFFTYKRGYELVGNTLIDNGYSKVYNCINGGIEGHTGYMLSFNNSFLSRYKFNDTFIYGGYDFFLTCAILGKCMEQFVDEFKKVPKTQYDFIDTDIVHIHHGSKLDRKTKWNLYSSN